MKKIFFLSFFVVVQVFSQSNINKYKYIDVPKKYSFLKSEDKYQLNSLTRFLFKKEGFNVLSSQKNHPTDYKLDICTALTVNPISKSSLFGTKIIIELINCDGKVVFTSKEGKSGSKDYKTSYHEALRNAFKSIESLHYKYVPQPNETSINTAARKVESVKEEPVPKVFKKESDNSQVLVEEVIVETIKGEEQSSVNTIVNKNNLFAQPIANGYQLVDTSPKVVFILKNTSIKDIYVIKGKDGVVFYKDGNWVAEYYEGDKLIREALSIKF